VETSIVKKALKYDLLGAPVLVPSPDLVSAVSGFVPFLLVEIILRLQDHYTFSNSCPAANFLASLKRHLVMQLVKVEWSDEVVWKP
jgi:hypothetical protein